MKVRELVNDMRINGFRDCAAMLEAQKDGDARLMDIEKRAWQFRAGMLGREDFHGGDMMDYILARYVEALNQQNAAIESGHKGALVHLLAKEAKAWRAGIYCLAGELPPYERLQDDLAQLKLQGASND